MSTAVPSRDPDPTGAAALAAAFATGVPDIPPLPEVDFSIRSPSGFRLSQRIAGDLVALADFLAVAASAAFVFWFARFNHLTTADYRFDLFLVAPAVALVAVLAFRIAGLQEMRNLMQVARQASHLLTVWAMLALVAAGVLVAFYDGPILVLLAWLCLTPAVLLAARAILALVFLHLLKRGVLARRVALIGAQPGLDRAAELICADRLTELSAVFELPTEVNSADLPKKITEIMERLAGGSFDDIVVLVPSTVEHGLDALIDHVAMLPLRIALLPVIALQTIDHPVPGDTFAYSVMVAEKPVRDWSIVFKTVFDYITALAMLALFAVPMLVIAIAIKLESPGPVMFRQHRTGLGGRIFRIWKFRSMHVLEDRGLVPQAQREDDRVTRVGRVIRRLSLDELPQIFNVLAGDMSVIGPRPHARAHDAYYARLIPDYRLRFRVKPGISGWAQIHGCRGETKTVADMARRVNYDIQYAVGYSFWRDVYVVAMTPFFGVLSSNSY